jgi:signal transduction histidine kinase
MIQTWKPFAAFLVAALVLIGAMTSLTVIGHRLDEKAQLANIRADGEQRIRLALWRMDATVGPIIAQENARPYFEYAPFYSAERAYTNMFAPLGPGEVIVPSPLLTYQSQHISIHFQFASDGSLTSPQIPVSNMRDLAETGFKTQESIEEARLHLSEFGSRVPFSLLRDAFAVSAANNDSVDDNNLLIGEKASNEYQQRAKAVQQSITTQITTNRVLMAEPPEMKPAVSASTMKTLWVNGELLFVRSAPVDGKVYLQGCWVDWPALRSELLLSIEDLVADPTLEPAREDLETDINRRLAAAPIRLNTNIGGTINALSPLRIALAAAWACVIAVIAAMGALLWGVLALSERRATFVSAVTHELRTPLTTFQLYTDLLAENRVPDEQKRQSYFETLRNEATRLRHLVENVLAFARLERTPAQQPLESINITDLAERIRPGVEAQCNRVGMKLELDNWNHNGSYIKTNAEMLEQIITNLIDNACKYAATAEDKRITLGCRQTPTRLILSVRDYGPGLHPDAARKLFRPFAKSATEAASSAPGIGLGLALSRRLARSLGGDLRWCSDVAPGCCFECELPAHGTIQN